MSSGAYGPLGSSRLNDRFGPNSQQGILPQSEITINAGVNANLPDERKGYDGERRLGSYSSVADLSLLEGEIGLSFRDDFGPAGPNTAFTASVFTSLNGLSLEGIETQSALYRKLRFQGMVNSPVYLENDVVNNSGTALRKHGSGSMLCNYGVDTFFSGDLLGYELPPIDEEGLRRFMHRRLYRGGPPEHKILARPCRIDPKKISEVLHDSVDTLLEKCNAPLMDIPAYLTKAQTGVTYLEHDKEIAVLLKQFVMNVSFNALQAAMHHGLVVPCYREGTRPNINAENHATLCEKLATITPANWDQSRVRLDAAETQGFVVESLNSPEEMRARKRECHDFAELTATWLGLARDQYRRPFLVQHPSLGKEILLRSLQSLSKRHGTVARQMIDGDFVDQHSEFDSFGMRRNTSTLAGQMYGIQTSAAGLFADAYGQATNLLMSRVIGTVSNVSAPGAPIHYAI